MEVRLYLAHFLCYFASKRAKKEAMRSKTKIDTREAWSHKHDFPIEEVGNTNKAIALLIVPHLQAFKALDKYGSPPDFTDIRQWNNTIQKMIDAFELLMQDKPQLLLVSMSMLLKTDDIHPPKTEISVHFSCSLP